MSSLKCLLIVIVVLERVVLHVPHADISILTMCYKCVKDKTLNRGTFCSDSCCLLSNFAGCSECGSSSAFDIKTDKPVIVQGDTEVLTRNHLCRCGHVIGEHTSEFWVESGHQEYRMDCHLCGFGEDSISIVPK